MIRQYLYQYRLCCSVIILVDPPVCLSSPHLSVPIFSHCTEKEINGGLLPQNKSHYKTVGPGLCSMKENVRSGMTLLKQQPIIQRYYFWSIIA